MEQEPFEFLFPQSQRKQVEAWRGKRIEDMTRDEAITALKGCAAAYLNHLKDDKEVWERQRTWGHHPRDHQFG